MSLVPVISAAMIHRNMYCGEDELLSSLWIHLWYTIPK